MGSLSLRTLCPGWEMGRSILITRYSIFWSSRMVLIWMPWPSRTAVSMISQIPLNGEIMNLLIHIRRFMTILIRSCWMKMNWAAPTVQQDIRSLSIRQRQCWIRANRWRWQIRWVRISVLITVRYPLPPIRKECRFHIPQPVGMTARPSSNIPFLILLPWRLPTRRWSLATERSRLKTMQKLTEERSTRKAQKYTKLQEKEKVH